jgi:hypothetical protein
MALDAIQQAGLESIGDALVLAFKRELLAQDHRAKGELIDSIAKSVKLTIEGGELIITMNGYGRYVDLGRKPGAKPVPIGVLTDWVIQKGIETDISRARGVAFAIQKTIVREGIPTLGSLALNSPKTDFINLAYESEKDSIDQEMQEILTRSMVATFDNLVRETQVKFDKQ